MRKSRWLIIVTLAVLLAVPATAADDDNNTPPKDKQSFTLDMGYQGSTLGGALFRAAEYEVADSNPLASLSWTTSPYAKTLFSIYLRRINSQDAGAALHLDANRIVRVDASFDSLLHRLDHDPLDNMQGVSGDKVARRTDFEPNAEYQIRRQLYHADVFIHPPSVKWLSFRVGVREEQRDGMRQMLAMSHCTSCHVTSRGRTVDQSTTDLTVGAHVRTGRLDLDYELLSRDFEEDGATPQAPYEKAYHPAIVPLATPLNDRLWFQDGSYPVDRIPKVERTAHRLKGRYGWEGGNALNLTVVLSNTQNDNTGLEYDFTGYRGRFTWKPADSLRVNFNAQRDKLDNDTFFVDLPSLVGLTGPPPAANPVYPGLTYEQWRQAVDGDPTLNFTDFLRRSSLDRTEDRLGVDVLWRPIRHGTLRGTYKYRNVDRDNVVLADGTGETTTQTVKLAWNQRVARKLRWNTTVRYDDVDNPYVNVDGGCRQFLGPVTDGSVPGTSPSPLSPLSLQYYQLQALRISDLSNVPSQTFQVRSHATWSPKGNWALSGNVRYRDSDNDDLDTSTWSRDTTGGGVSLWVATSPKSHFTVSYDTLKEDTDARTCVPFMDG